MSPDNQNGKNYDHAQKPKVRVAVIKDLMTSKPMMSQAWTFLQLQILTGVDIGSERVKLYLYFQIYVRNYAPYIFVPLSARSFCWILFLDRA